MKSSVSIVKEAHSVQRNFQVLEDFCCCQRLCTAAGGVLWKLSGNNVKVAVIHRNRYDDWSLPKGKLEKGEAWQTAALREVEEETGCSPVLISFAGSTAYSVQGTAKVVLFWNMIATSECSFVPNEEVDSIRWIDFDEAIDLLTYDSEKKILQRQKTFKEELSLLE